MNVCDTKKFFDVEYEAVIAAAKMEGKHEEEFHHYKCGNHWHVTHTDPKKRRGAGKNFWRCPKCKLIAKRDNAERHTC